mgnify:CR=1 FL=1
MRTPTLCLTIVAAGGLLGPSLGEDLFGKDPLPPPSPPAAAAPAPDPAAPAPDAPAASGMLVAFDPAQCQVGKPSQSVAARTLPGIRIWSAQVMSKSPKIALFKVQRWVARDTWLTESFQVRKKEPIGSPRVPKGQFQPVDFDTRWAFLDVTEQEVTRQKVRVVPVWDPQRPGVKIGERQEPYEEKGKCDVLRLAYLDANGNPAMGKDGKPLEATVESGAKSPVELPVFTEQDLLPPPRNLETP